MKNPLCGLIVGLVGVVTLGGCGGEAGPLGEGDEATDEVSSSFVWGYSNTGSCGPDLQDWSFDTNHYQCSVLGRLYYVYLPVGYNPALKYPVIVNLHGGGGNADNIENNARYHTPYVAGQASNFADAKGVIVVEPEGNALAIAPNSRTWNAGSCCRPSAVVLNVDDVGFLRAVVSDVKANFSVEAKRVFVSGHSNGGIMAHRLACQAGDVFAAAVSISGGRGNYDPGTGTTFYTCPAGRKSPILEIHGDADGCYNWNGGPGYLAQSTTFRAVPDSMDFGGDWGTIHGCGIAMPLVYSVGDGLTTTACWQWNNCSVAGAATLCRVYGGGHVWPGGSGPYETQAQCGGLKPQTIGNEFIWSFMSSHPMP